MLLPSSLQYNENSPLDSSHLDEEVAPIHFCEDIGSSSLAKACLLADRILGASFCQTVSGELYWTEDIQPPGFSCCLS